MIRLANLEKVGNFCIRVGFAATILFMLTTDPFLVGGGEACRAPTFDGDR